MEDPLSCLSIANVEVIPVFKKKLVHTIHTPLKKMRSNNFLLQLVTKKVDFLWELL